MYPTPVNVTVGVQATFWCRHATANTIGWSVNNISSLSELTMMNINSVTEPSNSSIQSTLTLDALSECNGSVVKCLALFQAAPPEVAPSVVMLIQGELILIISPTVT